MIKFRYNTFPWNVNFGVGALAWLPDELDTFGYSLALLENAYHGHPPTPV